jgi:hypothetical protein
MAPFKPSDVAHGISAYAAKQAALSRRLANRFITAWNPTLRALDLQPQWEPQLPTAAGINPDPVFEQPFNSTGSDDDEDLLDLGLSDTEDEFQEDDDDIDANDFELDDD